MIEISDLQQKWEEEKKSINNKILEAAKKKGIKNKKDTYLNYQFKELNIVDSYRDQNGELCYHCLKNMKCKKHGLKKK